MRILLTGGAGFIGSTLTRKLLDSGNYVCCADDFNDYYDPNIKRNNINGYLPLNNYKVYEVDIQDYAKLKDVFALEKFDAVIHLAARAGVRPSILEPDLYNRVNVIGTTNLLELSRLYKINQFIFGSTSSVYGVNSKVPFSESDPIDSPISPYAATKIAGEKLSHVYHYLYGFNVTILRFFTVYGPRQRPEMAIHKFASKIIKGEPIEMFGDGSSRRDYTFVDDIVEGILLALNKNYKFDIFNLGNSNTVSLAELVDILQDSLGKKAVLSYLENQPGDVPVTYADISKSMRLLGYLPKTKIKDGISKFSEWFLNKN